MNDDFNRPDPILDDQRWWGTNGMINADNAARRQALSPHGIPRNGSRISNRRNWTIILIGWAVLATFGISKIFF